MKRVLIVLLSDDDDVVGASEKTYVIKARVENTNADDDLSFN